MLRFYILEKTRIPMNKWLIRSLVLFLPFITLQAEEEERQTKISIIRDIMQPLGLPLIANYYEMRENVFLNMKCSKPNPFEAFGNLCLIPTRYLFGGKNVHLNEEKCESIQSFKYRHRHWLKGTAALIAFPITHTVGSLFKGIGYLFPETRKKHHAVREALYSLKLKSNLELYTEAGLSQLYSSEQAPCQNHKRPSTIHSKHKKEIEALRQIVKLLEENQIVYWLDCGTCIGAYRYGGFIPWDVDIDIAIIQADSENVKRALLQLDPKKYQIQDWSSYDLPQTFLKLYIKETQTQIDIYHYGLDPEKKTATYIYSYENSFLLDDWKKPERAMVTPYPYDTLFPLKRAQFDGIAVWVPNNIEAFLKSKYGENLDPTMVWNENTKKYDKVEDHPYWKIGIAH